MTSSRRRDTSQWLLAAAVLAVLAAGGCSKSTNRVTGSVTLEGVPLPSGRVSFVCEGVGKPVIEAAIVTGSYAITNPPPGRVQVIVQTIPPRPKLDLGDDAPSPSPSLGEAKDASEYVPIPVRYSATKTSGLECTIQPGEQTFDIELSKR